DVATSAAAALVTIEDFQRQIERYLEKLWYVRRARARPDGRDFHRPFGGEPIVHVRDAAFIVERADRVIGAWHAKIAEFPAIESGCLVAHDLLQHQGRRPGADCEDIGLGA